MSRIEDEEKIRRVMGVRGRHHVYQQHLDAIHEEPSHAIGKMEGREFKRKTHVEVNLAALFHQIVPKHP